MNAAVIRAGIAHGLKLARAQHVVLAMFAGTLFLSALLLFSVQPIFAKMVLPQLGGSPSVWAVSMCFFQAMLLAGYCYAHALNRYAPARYAPVIHFGVMATAVLALPFGVPAGAEPPAGDAYLWLIGVLTLGVGLPFFAVSANAPLLQAWFGRSHHPHAQDPYFLYGASNLGSLIALLAYPVAIEPFFGLGQQAGVWTAGFLLLAISVTACGALIAGLTAAGTDAARTNAAAEAGDATPVAWSERLVWIGLAFVPSGLLVAFTSYVTTDIASAPFLWVIPLATFLATFILVFRDEPLIPHRWLLTAQPLLVAVTLLGLSIPGNRGWAMAIVAGAGAFFVTTMVCHRELYERRPQSRHLTEFYLFMSLGGVLGGMFAALLAPQLFNTIFEYPLLLVLGMACRPGLAAALADSLQLRQAATMTACLLAAMALIGMTIGGNGVPENAAAGLVILGGAALMLAAGRQPLRQVAYVAVMAIALYLLPSAMNQGFAERSFFGVHRVVTSESGDARILMHGTTRHGAQRLLDAEGNPVTEPMPATYYYPGSPMARGVDIARAVNAPRGGALSVGLVGLGAGSLACYSRPEEAWRFYEIDPVVVKLATDPSLFTFMSRCQPGAEIVLGDARLTVGKEPAAMFDYLVIDAFSSDSIPVHLLTREALEMFLSKLTPDGILALHISNRHMDLIGVATATARSIPGTFIAFADDRQETATLDKSSNHVLYVTRSERAIAPLAELPYVRPVAESDIAPWTDDYSNVLSAILRHYWK